LGKEESNIAAEREGSALGKVGGKKAGCNAKWELNYKDTEGRHYTEKNVGKPKAGAVRSREERRSVVKAGRKGKKKSMGCMPTERCLRLQKEFESNTVEWVGDVSQPARRKKHLGVSIPGERGSNDLTSEGKKGNRTSRKPPVNGKG